MLGADSKYREVPSYCHCKKVKNTNHVLSCCADLICRISRKHNRVFNFHLYNYVLKT